MVGKILILICIGCLITTGCAKEGKSDIELSQSEELTLFSEEELEEAPEEMLSSFSVSGYSKGGKRQWDLEGKSADIMSEEIKMTDVTGKVYGKEVNMTIVADEGSLNRIDNNVHLEKNVRAVTDDGATLTTDYLDWDAQDQRLTSDAPVWIKRGMMEASGIGIIGQPTLNLVELKEDVTVKIFLQEEGAVTGSNSALANASNGTDESESSLLTIITCDRSLEIDYQNNLAIFQDNVKVKDKRGEIFADKMDVYFSTQNQNEKSKQLENMEGMGIDKIIAEGFVEIHHGGNVTYSQKAVYDTESGKLTLTGQPKLVIYSTEGFSQTRP